MTTNLKLVIAFLEYGEKEDDNELCSLSYFATH